MHYFDDLNYTLSNEDTRIEHGLLKKGADHVFSIAGSGARVLPLIAKHPKNLNVIDMSQEQLYLNELRLAAAQELTYEEFLFFIGYRGGLAEGDPQGDDRT
ncbi:MAG: BtaA family protein, partial [Bdellovibrionaceae bacterium]|nr:BtaA family protein [Pseudobdellovibrionaceae bacterium]